MKFILPDGSGYQTIELKGDGVVNVQSFENVDDVLRANERERNGATEHIELGTGTQTSMRKLGELSALKAHQLMQSGVFWDDDALRLWFKDLDNYLWGVTRGKSERFHAVQSL